ncbi:UDP-glucose 4-epimerase GalE [Bremerella sp. JC817]|uniref:UDP-glucose 4-epimerase GalE n=1 Tax=Bremerella sp. JC817 TaxID=3231756 RepID=UPI0034589987
MRVLVVGGAGYIGSHTARKLAATGHDVVVYDNLSAGHRDAVSKLPLVEGDLLETDRLTATMQQHKIEAVIHFAAFALVGESVTNPAKYYQNNITGTLSLLDAMRAADVPRIVFSSTCATYGIPASSPIDESFPQSPVNPYGFTKLAIEHALQDYAHAYGMSFAALRYFNAAGASPDGDIGEDHTPESHLIPLVLQVALGQRKSISIFGDDYPTPDKTCIRDYIHVDDLADAHLAAMEQITPGNCLKLNLGTGRGVSVLEIIDACRDVTGHEIPTEMAPRREGDPPALVANPTQAHTILGWQPQYLDVRETIETAWRWHQSHPHGYAK